MAKLGDRVLKILEQYIQGKENNPDTCEDGLYIGEDIIAVLERYWTVLLQRVHICGMV